MVKIEIEFADGPSEDDSGRKRLTFENLLEVDPASVVVSNFRFEDAPPIDGPPWPERQHEILRPRLSAAVPRDIVSLFEAAQAAMAYGYYFFPLYDVGCGTLFRAFDLAAVTRAKREGCTEERLMLANALAYLKKKGVLSKEDFERLQPLRKLRNFSSHPPFQARTPVGFALWSLDDVAKEIEALVGAVSESR